MTKSLIRNVTRRKVAVAAASIAAAGALAVPGVAWAQNSLPGSEPVVVSTPAAEATAACSTENMSGEEIQKLKDSGENGPAVTEAGASTESIAASVLSEAASIEAGSAPTEAGAASAVTATTVSADAVMITARAC